MLWPSAVFERECYWSEPPGLQSILKTKNICNPFREKQVSWLFFSKAAFLISSSFFTYFIWVVNGKFVCSFALWKNLLNVPLCPLENRGFFLFPLWGLNISRFRFESFVRLHFNSMFPMNSLVLCSTVPIFPRKGTGRSAWEGWCSHNNLERREEKLLGARAGWQGGAAASWGCVAFPCEKGGRDTLAELAVHGPLKQQGLQSGGWAPFLLSGSLAVRQGKKWKQIYFLLLKFNIFSPIFN